MKEQFKRGVFFNSIAQFSTVIVQLIINMVLSRTLTPAEIGMVTMVQVLIFFFQLFASQGFTPAIIQNKALTTHDYGVIFNYSILLGIFLVLVFGGIGGPLLATLFHNSEYIRLSWTMSFMILGSAVSAVPNGILSKEKRFREISTRTVIAGVLGMILGIGAAFLHMGVYAMVIALTVPEIFYLLFNLFTVKIQFSHSFAFLPIQEILAFSKHQVIFSFVNYFYRNIDNLSVGKLLGPTPLGNYSKSYQLLSMPITILLNVLSPVMQPILSEQQDNVQLIRETYLRISHLLALLGIPISVFISLNAKPIIYLLFGNQWTAAIQPLAILSLSIWAQMLSQAMIPIWQSRNLPRYLSMNALISLVIISASVLLGILLTHSLDGVATAVVISYLLNFLLSAWLLINNALGGKFLNLIKKLYKSFILGLALYALLYFINRYFIFSNYFIELILRGIVCAILFIGLLYASGEIKIINGVLKSEK
jgi:PST family polysaccharide transporter